MMETLFQDVKFGLRMLAKNPGFTIIAVMTLALGIGANTTIFSVVNAMLLRQLPYAEPDRLVMVWENNRPRDGQHNVVNPGNYLRWRERNTSFARMGMLNTFPANVSGGIEPERVPVGFLSPSIFEMTGTRAVLGRVFVEADDQEGPASAVAVLSHGYWQRKFGGDAGVIGRTLQVNGRPVQVVGVAPAHFTLLPQAEMFVPQPTPPSWRESRGRWMSVLGQLKPGVSYEQAAAEMEAIGRQLEQERPDFNTGWGVQLQPLREHVVGKIETSLLILFAAAACVLLIACANVANLLLARTTARRREIAIRIALGIGRARLVRQMLTESVLLAILGGAAAILVAWWSLGTLLALLPAELRVAVPVSVDLPVLAFSLAVTLLTGMLFGLAPAAQALRRGPNENLKDGERVVTGAGKRTRSALIVAETALAVILLAGAGLLIRSFAAVRGLDAGFQPENVMTMQVSLAGERYRERPQQIAFFREAVERIQSVPGVQYAGAISWRPLGVGSATTFLVDELPPPAAGQEPVAEVRAVEGDFFRAMGIPLLRGRSFDATQDRAEHAVKKVVVSETMVRNFWPGQDPIGKRISMEWYDMLHAEVIGVVKDVRIRDLEVEPRNTIYWYQPQFPYSFMTLVARTAGDPQQVVAGIRSQIAALDPELPVAAVASMEEVIDTTLQQRRFGVVLLGTLAGLALLLASVGLYGVISYSVAQRTPEFGVRLALGAPPRQILRLVLVSAARMAAVGLAAGTLGALALARFMSSFVFGVSTRDPLTLFTVAVLLGLVALFASLAPAWRAMRVDPMVALRYE